MEDPYSFLGPQPAFSMAFCFFFKHLSLSFWNGPVYKQQKRIYLDYSVCVYNMYTYIPMHVHLRFRESTRNTKTQSSGRLGLQSKASKKLF